MNEQKEYKLSILKEADHKLFYETSKNIPNLDIFGKFFDVISDFGKRLEDHSQTNRSFSEFRHNLYNVKPTTDINKMRLQNLELVIYMISEEEKELLMHSLQTGVVPRYWKGKKLKSPSRFESPAGRSWTGILGKALKAMFRV